ERRGGPAVEARVVELVAEDEAGALVMVGDEDEESDDRHHAQHVPADRDVVEETEQLVGEDVHQRVERQDDHEQQERLAQDVLGVGEVDADHVDAVEAEQGVQEARRAVPHRGHDAEQPGDVEPAGEPAPTLAAQARGPPVGPAGSGEGRGELGHREGDHEDEEADDRPADRDGDRAAGVPSLAEARERPGEDRDDRERDREVREAAPRPRELLLVAQLRETLLVANGVLISLCHVPSLSAGGGRARHGPVRASVSGSSDRTQPRRPGSATRTTTSSPARSTDAIQPPGSPTERPGTIRRRRPRHRTRPPWRTSSSTPRRNSVERSAKRPRGGGSALAPTALGAIQPSGAWQTMGTGAAGQSPSLASQPASDSAACRPSSAATSAGSAPCSRLPAANTPGRAVRSAVSTRGPRVPGSSGTWPVTARSWAGIQSPVKP